MGLNRDTVNSLIEIQEKLKETKSALKDSSRDPSIVYDFMDQVLKSLKVMESEHRKLSQASMPEFPTEIKADITGQEIKVDPKSFPSIFEVTFPTAQKVSVVDELYSRVDFGRNERQELVRVSYTYPSFSLIYDLERDNAGNITSVKVTKR